VFDARRARANEPDIDRHVVDLPVPRRINLRCAVVNADRAVLIELRSCTEPQTQERGENQQPSCRHSIHFGTHFFWSGLSDGEMYRCSTTPFSFRSARSHRRWAKESASTSTR